MTGLWERAADAAIRIENDSIAQGYCQARRLNRAHGRTYYLATLLLPPAKRRYVHALYGFARYADDIVDDTDPAGSPEARRLAFQAWRERFVVELEQDRSSDPITAALFDTMNRWQIPGSYFIEFLDSMAMDLTVTEYQTYPELREYMWGSAAVIGLQMLPVLGFDADRLGVVRRSAIDLGLAFQLTNFIRDVGEDLDRGRIYLPQESLRWSGVDRERLVFANKSGRVDGPIKRLLMLEIERARQLYRSAEPGIDFLDVESQDCMRTALVLYREILDRIEHADYEILAGRISVPIHRRVQVAGPGLLRARRTRHKHH